MLTTVDTSVFAEWSGPSPEPFPVVGAYGGPGSDLKQWATRTVEKVRSAVAGGLRFLPRLDNYTDETQEIRESYRLMLREPVLKSAHKTKVAAVAQLDWRVIPTDRNPRDLEISEFVRYALKHVVGGTVHIARAVLKGVLLDGFSVCEKVWREPLLAGKWKGKRIWRAIKAKDTNHLTLSTDQYRNVVAVRPTAYGIGDTYNPKDFVIISYDALFESVLGCSDHRAAYGSFWFKDTIKKLWGLHLDKYVSPALMGTYAHVAQKAALEKALEECRSSTWLTIPEGAAVQALQLATRGEAEFEAACDYQDRQMLIATAGSYLQTLEGKIIDGRGDTGIHRDGAALFQWDLAADLTAVANEQLIPELVELNFAGADCPTIALGSISDKELQASVAVDKDLQAMGFKHSRRRFAEYYGREEAETPDDVLSPTPPPQPGQPQQPVGPLFPQEIGAPPLDKRATTFAEEETVEDDPDAFASMMADILYGLFGDDSLSYFDVASDEDAGEGVPDEPNVRKFAGWAELDHPRGPNGRFIPKGSEEARTAAKEVVGRVLRGEKTPESAEEVAKHLAILTVKQLAELHKQHGQKPPGRLREQLVAAVKSRLPVPEAKKPVEPEQSKTSEPKTITHAGREFRVYTREQYLAARRELPAQGWKMYDASNGSLAGTPVLKELMAVQDKAGMSETILVARKAPKPAPKDDIGPAPAAPKSAADVWLQSHPAKSGAVLQSVMAGNPKPGTRVDLKQAKAASGLSDADFNNAVTDLAASGALTAAVKSDGQYTSAAVGHPKDIQTALERAAQYSKPAPAPAASNSGKQALTPEKGSGRVTPETKTLPQETPKMTGTEKQVAWAEKIKADSLADAKKRLQAEMEDGDEKAAAALRAGVEFMERANVAKGWIDGRNQPGYAIAQAVGEAILTGKPPRDSYISFFGNHMDLAKQMRQERSGA